MEVTAEQEVEFWADIEKHISQPPRDSPYCILTSSRVTISAEEIATHEGPMDYIVMEYVFLAVPLYCVEISSRPYVQASTEQLGDDQRSILQL